MIRPNHKINTTYYSDRLVTINIEGYDGIGKSTIIKTYMDMLANNDIHLNTFHYPNYDGTIGKLIKDILNGKYDLSLITKEELIKGDMLTCAFILDRWITERMDIDKNTLHNSPILLMDRSKYSNLIYYIIRNCKLANVWTGQKIKYLYNKYITSIYELEPPSRSIFEINVILVRNKAMNSNDMIEKMIDIEKYNHVISAFQYEAVGNTEKWDETRYTLGEYAWLSDRFIRFDLPDFNEGITEEKDIVASLQESVKMLHVGIVNELKSQIEMFKKAMNINPLAGTINPYHTPYYTEDEANILKRFIDLSL